MCDCTSCGLRLGPKGSNWQLGTCGRCLDDCGRKIALKLEAADGEHEVECALVWIAFGLHCYCNPRIQEAMKDLWPEEHGEAPTKGKMPLMYYMPDLRYPKGDLRRYELSIRLTGVDKILWVAPAYVLNAVVWIQRPPWQFSEARRELLAWEQAGPTAMTKRCRDKSRKTITPPGARPGRSWRDADGYIVCEDMAASAGSRGELPPGFEVPSMESEHEQDATVSGTVVKVVEKARAKGFNKGASEYQLPSGMASGSITTSTDNLLALYGATCCTLDDVKVNTEPTRCQHGLQSCTESSRRVPGKIAETPLCAYNATPKARCAACAMELSHNSAVWCDYAQQYTCCVICARHLEVQSHMWNVTVRGLHLSSEWL